LKPRTPPDSIGALALSNLPGMKYFWLFSPEVLNSLQMSRTTSDIEASGTALAAAASLVPPVCDRARSTYCQHLDNHVSTQNIAARLICPMISAAVVLFGLTGCVAPRDRAPNYELSEPVPRLVHYRVSQDDVLELTMVDGKSVYLTVDKVDEVFIHGQDGPSVPIADIRKLRCLDTTDAGDAAMAILVYTVMVPVSIVAFPVAVPVALFYDWDKLEQWPEGRLCRVVEHPERYGYSDPGVNKDDENKPTLQQVSDEIGRRELTCDPIRRAERYCAYFAQSGGAFNDCAGQMAALELGGYVGIPEWSDSALCQVHLNPGEYEPLGMLPTWEPQTVVQAVGAEVKNRELTCPTGS
jgi:hypothetical protein